MFSADDFDALLELSGDQGARAILEANRERLRTIACAAAAVDIDRPDDLRNV